MNSKALAGLFAGVALTAALTGCPWEGPRDIERRETLDRDASKIAFNFSERAKRLHCANMRGYGGGPDSSAIMAFQMLYPSIEPTMWQRYLGDRGLQAYNGLFGYEHINAGAFDRKEGVRILSKLDQSGVALVSAAASTVDIVAVFYNEPEEPATLVIYGGPQYFSDRIALRAPNRDRYSKGGRSGFEYMSAFVEDAGRGNEMVPGVHVFHRHDGYRNGMLDESEWRIAHFPPGQPVSVVTRTAEGKVEAVVDIPRNPCGNGQQVAASPALVIP